MRRWTALLALVVLAVSACGSANTKAAPSSSTPSTTPTGPTDLTAALLATENQPKYKPSDWGYIAIDQKTGEVLAAQNPDKMFDPGSTMKSFSVTAALKAYGNDYKITTPVYRVGNVNGHVLKATSSLSARAISASGCANSRTAASTTRTSPCSTTATPTSASPARSSPPATRLRSSTSSPRR